MANPPATPRLRRSQHVTSKKYVPFNRRARIFWAATLLGVRLLLKWRSSSKDKGRKWPFYCCSIPTSQVTTSLVQPMERQIPRHSVTSFGVTLTTLLLEELKGS